MLPRLSNSLPSWWLFLLCYPPHFSTWEGIVRWETCGGPQILDNWLRESPAPKMTEKEEQDHEANTEEA